jgi:hypothetical protein
MREMKFLKHMFNFSSNKDVFLPNLQQKMQFIIPTLKRKN